MTPAELALDIASEVQLIDNTPEDAKRVKAELISLIANALVLERRAGAEAMREKASGYAFDFGGGLGEAIGSGIRILPLPEMADAVPHERPE